MKLAIAAGRWALIIVLWLIVAACLAITIVPRFLDRIYYEGPESGHYDGARFFNPDGDDSFAPPAGRSRGGFILRQLQRDPTRPEWPARVAVTPFVPPARVEGDRMLVTWVGHATMLVQSAGVNILTDPIWSDTAGPFGIGPARVAKPGIDFDRLPKIDIVLVSHNHYDHMDLATLKRLWDRDKPLIVTSLGNDSVIGQAGVKAVALDWNRAVTLTDDTLTGKAHEIEEGMPRCDPAGACPWDRATVLVTRNHHWGSRWFTDRNRALWSSFVVSLPGGNFFFAGDTGIGDGKWPAEAAALGPVRLAGIPVGAFRFEEGQMGTGSHIGPADAIRVWDGLGRPAAVPIHWGTFRLSREGYFTPPRLLAAMLRCAGSDTRLFAPLEIGVPREVPTLDQQRAAAVPAPRIERIAACEKAGDFDRFP